MRALRARARYHVTHACGLVVLFYSVFVRILIMETARRALLPAFGPHVVWWVAFFPSFAGLARTYFVATNPNSEMPVFTVASLTSSVMNPCVYPGVPKTVRRRPSCLPTRGRCM